MTRKKTLDVIIPTRNDYVCLMKIIQKLSFSQRIEKIIVVDNDSKKALSKKIKSIVCLFPKAFYVECSFAGKGNAIGQGLKYIDNDVLFLDADIENFSFDMVIRLLRRFDEGFDLVKANFRRNNGQSNSIFVIKRLKSMYPDLDIKRPTGGIYIVKGEFVREINIPRSWNVDLSILLQAHEYGLSIAEEYIGTIKDKCRSCESLLESKKCLLLELKRNVQNGL
jgi:hypothetical protein